MQLIDEILEYLQYHPMSSRAAFKRIFVEQAEFAVHEYFWR